MGKRFCGISFCVKGAKHINEKNNRNKNKEGKEIHSRCFRNWITFMHRENWTKGRENDGLDEGRAGFREQKPLPDDV